jgi:hypothetical protein
MAIKYVQTLSHNMLDEITALIDAGAGAGTLRIYDGTVPADADTALSGNTLLAQLTMSDPSAAAASGDDWTASSITADSSADASGTATFFRILDSNANVVLQGTVAASGADLNLSPSAVIAITDNVDVTSLVITEGNT